jgi:hypothetical protein
LRKRHPGRGANANALALVPEIDQEEGPPFDFSILRLSLKDDASKNLDLDISSVMDCCYSAIRGRGSTAAARVELMAATSLMKSAMQGMMATRLLNFGATFKKLLATGEKFTRTDIVTEINSHPKQVQYWHIFVLQEGWELPITFCSADSETPYHLPLWPELLFSHFT